jgi:hypothetical protein
MIPCCIRSALQTRSCTTVDEIGNKAKRLACNQGVHNTDLCQLALSAHVSPCTLAGDLQICTLVTLCLQMWYVYPARVTIFLMQEPYRSVMQKVYDMGIIATKSAGNQGRR